MNPELLREIRDRFVQRIKEGYTDDEGEQAWEKACTDMKTKGLDCENIILDVLKNKYDIDVWFTSVMLGLHYDRADRADLLEALFKKPLYKDYLEEGSKPDSIRQASDGSESSTLTDFLNDVVDGLKHKLSNRSMMAMKDVYAVSEHSKGSSFGRDADWNMNSSVLDRLGYKAAQCKLLNTGAFGRVYKYYCDGNGTGRAVKIIKYNQSKTIDKNRSDIKNEYDIGKLMESKNVGPQLYKITFDDTTQTAAIEMELMDINLLEFLQRFGFDQASADMLSQILSEKLAAMAKLGYKCLDLKPENVMVNTKHGNILKLRIIDFDPKFCSVLHAPDQSTAAEIAMKLMLAANTHRVHPKKLLLFESDLSSIDDSTIDDMLSSDDDASFFETAWYYLIKDEKANRKACVKNVLRDLVNEAKGASHASGAKRRRGSRDSGQ